jgi:hypothetical protein
MPTICSHHAVRSRNTKVEGEIEVKDEEKIPLKRKLPVS